MLPAMAPHGRRRGRQELRLKPGEHSEPASASMHKSSLYHKDNFVLPQMSALERVESALRNDAASHALKFDALEVGCLGSARFRQKPVPGCSPRGLRLKAISAGTSSECPALDPASPSAAQCVKQRPARPPCLKELGFNKHTLHVLFREIDHKATGFITHRALMFALNERLGREMVADNKSVPEALHWLRNLAKEVDVEGEGSMNWKTFLEFFRQAGLLVEYDKGSSDIEAFKGALEGNLSSEQENMKNSSRNSSSTGQEHAKLQSEIRLSGGKAQEARFNKNRRAGSPVDDSTTGGPEILV